MTFVFVGQASPRGFKATSPRPLAVASKVSVVASAKESQRKADEETHKRIQAWKAQQQAKEVG